MTFYFRYKKFAAFSSLQLICSLLLLFSSIQISLAQHDRNANFLGVAIYRFAQHITWPDAEKIKQYRIHIIDENPDVEKVLKNIASTRTLHNRPIIVSHSDAATVPRYTQVVFVARHSRIFFDKILTQLKNSATLLISYDIDGQHDVMINFISDKNSANKIKFKINKANILNKNMAINPDIILLGGNEIDVAQLYREAQVQLSENRKELKTIQEKVRTVNKEKASIEKTLTELTLTIKQQKNNYNTLRQETKSQENKIQQQLKELTTRENHLKKQRNEIEKRSTILNVQQTKIKTLATTISNQNTVIKSQDETLSKSNEQIETQQSYLLLLSILITLALASALSAYLLYRKYRHVNLKLHQSLIKTEQYANRVEIANSQLKSFSYTVSHDLRAPLRSIAGFSQILNEDYAEALNKDAQKYLNRIVQNVSKMDNLITDILQLSKISRSELNAEDNINLSQIVNDEFQQLNQASPRVSLNLNIAPDILCRCDPALIKIVINNIVGNAWKYTPMEQEARFEFGSKTIQGSLTYYFKDNGVGFNMKYSNKLFEAFQRLHSASEFEGTGVGLATVKRIINLHQGDIWAQSELTKGATFYFTLYSH